MIRSVLLLHAIPGHRDEVLALFDRFGMRALLEEQRGLMAAELAVAVDDENEVMLIGEWASTEQLDRFAEGPLPRGLLDGIAELLVSEPTHRVYHVVESVS